MQLMRQLVCLDDQPRQYFLQVEVVVDSCPKYTRVYVAKPTKAQAKVEDMLGDPFRGRESS